MRERGFSLIEIVIALAILALSLGALYEAFGLGLRRAAVAHQREVALLTAQSVLAEIRGREPLAPGTVQGETAQGLKWESQIREREARIDPQSPLRAFDVTVEVSWGRGVAQRIRLQSIETGRRAS